jgi:transposase InsO family protein
MVDTLRMITELSVMEQRYQAVSAVIHDGFSVVEVASRFGVSRQTIHSWLLKYEKSGLPGLTNHSHKPKGCSHQISSRIDVLICEMRRRNPGWGPRRIEFELNKSGVSPMPSRSAIYRAIKRANLIDPLSRRRRDEKFKRWERAAPMELWQFDVVGGIYLTDGTELKCLTGVDDHSRFCVSAGLMRRANSKSVCDHLQRSLDRYGCPQEMLTDNGKVFTGRFNSQKDVEVLFDKICRENGIEHLLTAPRSPTTTGKIERFHRTLRTEFLMEKRFESFDHAQTQLDLFVDHYNTQRPHQSLDMATPWSKFTVAAPVVRAESTTPNALPAGTWAARRIGGNGVISIAWQQISVGKHRAGQDVDVLITDQMVHIYYKDELLKTALRSNNKEVRKKHASVLRKPS